MFQNLYEFTKGISSVEYETPIPVQIVMYLTLLIIFILLIIIFKESLDISAFRDNYMWYYFLFMFNIINICAVLGYYYMKNGTFIGNVGKPGNAGKTGEIGDNVNCTMCLQNNIYITETNQYSAKIDVSFEDIAKSLISSNLQKSLDDFSTTLNSNVFDYSEFSSNLLQGTYNLNNYATERFVLLSTYNEYPIVRYLNYNMGLGDLEQTGIFAQPSVGSHINSFPLSFTAFGGSETYASGSFLVSGAFKHPIGIDYSNSAKFQTTAKKGRSRYINTFEICSLRPPDDYLSMGIILLPYGYQNLSMMIKQYACLSKKCCKKLKPEQLNLMFIYPCASNPGSIEIEDKTAPDLSENVSEGFFSIWRTPLNTIYAKISTNNSFDAGKSLIENLYLYQGKVPSNIYDRSTSDDINENINVSRKIKKKTQIFFESIIIPNVISATTIFSNTIELIKENLEIFYKVHFDKPNPLFVPGPNIRKARNKDNIELNDIGKILKEIEDKLDDNYLRELENERRNYNKITKKRIKTLYPSGRTEEENERMMSSYSLKNDYQNIKSMIMNMSQQIKTVKNLYDLMKVIFPGGFNTTMEENKFTKTQMRIFNLLAVLIPPQENIYTIKNKCLVYDKIDDDKQELMQVLELEIKKYKMLLKKFSKDPNTFCGGGKNLQKMNEELTVEYNAIYETIGHIDSFVSDSELRDLQKYSKNRLEYLYSAFTRMNNIIMSYCG